MATIRDVAKLAGVSLSSVSAVTNGRRGVSPQLAERVRKAAEALDYHPDHVARSLRGRRTNIIGVIMPLQVLILFLPKYCGESQTRQAKRTTRS
jgi:DNA-binding LacI/PurR family transcriptional regulator